MPNTTEAKSEGGSRPPDAGEDVAWLDPVPVGREFGSPDYERLMALDQAAFAAFHSWDRVRQWLATPNPQLNGACPDDVARSPDGGRAGSGLAFCPLSFVAQNLSPQLPFHVLCF